MNKNDFFDEDYELDEDNSPFIKRMRHRKPDDEWDEDSEVSKRNKKKTRWRDIEDRLAKKALREDNDWSYGDYDF